jgi:hypothetical protein
MDIEELEDKLSAVDVSPQGSEEGKLDLFLAPDLFFFSVAA